ncbi:MAG: BrnT family toxin [Deltaproteobacteria bacterium]|nr:BrnT family toxin [Deltaproteobacteria bacterium]
MLEFEWDDAKAATNFRKHGVTFAQAAHAFRDLFAVEWIDARAAYDEERVILIGMSGGQILNVVYTERGERLRIISARRATKYEKDNYYRQNAS